MTHQALFQRAQKHIPGGVNSPVRAFKSVGGTPIFMKRGAGAYLYDEFDKKYIDYIASWGPLILGHAHKTVVAAISEYAARGTSFGAPTLLEVEMAELICAMVPQLESIRMVSSGTEACMSAIRLARGFTGRNKIIKMEGCYHGHADCFLVKAGSGLATLQIQTVPGIPMNVSQDTLTCPYNDLEAVSALVAAYPNEIAALIIEPVAGNMGCILPAPGYLEGLRSICTNAGILLVFDEVMTGFRLAAGGAQERFKLSADLVCFGKVIGGGMPVGAFGGRKDIMEKVAPLGQVYQAGTLSGNPIAMIAGLSTLSLLHNQPAIYSSLEQKTQFLAAGLQKAFDAAGVATQINQIGSMLSVHFSTIPITDFDTAAAANLDRFKSYFHYLLQNGVYLPPSPFESWFLNDALCREDLEETIRLSSEWARLQ